jgi:extracellular matrix regulatory protein A
MKATQVPGLVNVGYGNFVAGARVVAILSPLSAPMKRLREEARERGKLVDATQGRRTRSIIVTDTDHVVLSGVQAETMAQRFLGQAAADDGADDK